MPPDRQETWASPGRVHAYDRMLMVCLSPASEPGDNVETVKGGKPGAANLGRVAANQNRSVNPGAGRADPEHLTNVLREHWRKPVQEATAGRPASWRWLSWGLTA